MVTEELRIRGGTYKHCFGFELASKPSQEHVLVEAIEMGAGALERCLGQLAT